MSVDSCEVVVTFDSVQQAMQAEVRLRETVFAVSLVVTPRSVSSSCGFSLLIICERVEQLTQTLELLRIRYKKMYGKISREGITHYERL